MPWRPKKGYGSVSTLRSIWTLWVCVPLTLMIARAVQKYGGYGSDRNIWCMAANYEYDTTQTEAAQGNSRWYTQVQAKYGQAPENLHDFPFEHLQFAPKDWKGGI